MSRRSSRLVSGGYYNSDEESDSSTVTNISYRENTVKVFKKKSGARKAASRPPSRASSDAGSAAPAGQYEGPRLSPLSSQTPPTMRTTPYVPTVATPRPALTPSSSRGQTPTRCPSVPLEKGPYTGVCSSDTSGLHFRPVHKELSQSGVDSSGYSSCEGSYRRPAAASTSRVSGSSGSSGSPGAGYRARVTDAVYSVTDSASLMAAAAHSKILHVLAQASFSSRMKKACGLLLLFLVVLLCIWLLLPLFTSVISRMTVTKTTPKIQPAPSATPPPPPPQPCTTSPTAVVDPAVVSAAVEAKMKNLLVQLQLRQEDLVSQMKAGLQVDLQLMKARLEAVDSDGRRRLQQEVSGMGRQMEDYQVDSRSAATSLSLRIQTLEAQNAKLSQELSSIQLMPPPAPCPDPTTAPVLNHLTPELQEAMEKWLTNRIQEQEAVSLSDGGGCTHCGRPMADKMADFALETQGASVVSTRCSETYRIRSACVTLFGFPLWYPSESPRTVIQGYPVLLPGKCWAFHGVQGTLVISLSHPVMISHVTVDHLPRYNSPTGRIDSAPKDFEVYGMKNDTEEGTLLGTYTYDENGASTQTFEIPDPSDVLYRFVELRVLTNWGHVEYTCLYRFRVHGKMAAT